MTDWLQRYMDLAAHVAQWSKDPSTKVGAVAVGFDRREIAIGYNGFPPGIVDSADRLNDRETKYRYMQHAERNVLDNARFSLRVGTLATTLHPCEECAKSIISRGIGCVICPGIPSVDRWQAQARSAADMLREAGVDLVYMSDKWRRER